MAHKSREPQRRQRFKKSRPHDRGEKYVGPQLAAGEATGFWEPVALQRTVSRSGEAHALILKFKER
jgi:hypothetical protein